ncbi:MAG: MBL fold metallo-hydrolase [Candidatus Aminicenantales bacterium]
MRVLKTFAGVFFILLLISPTLPQAVDDIPIEIIRLSDRVLILKEDVMNNNITAIASQKGLVVVDTSGLPSTARKIRRLIEKEFNRKDFAYVINTHYHWDHSWGNQVFPEAKIIGHTECTPPMRTASEMIPLRIQNSNRAIEEQKNRLAQTDAHSKEAEGIRRSINRMERLVRDYSEDLIIMPPHITFNDRMTLDLGDLTLKMYFFGRAHSGADIFIHIPEEGVLLTGDIFIDRRWLPLFAGLPDLDIPKWIEVLSAVLDGEEKLSDVIPGHMDLWTPEKLDLWRDYIVGLWEGLKKAKAEGVSFEDAAARLPLDVKYYYLRENGHTDSRIQNFHRNNLEAFWSQLVESAARIVAEALSSQGMEAGIQKFDELKSNKDRYFFNERQFNNAGYQLLGSGRIDEAVAIFKMNVELYPESWNVYDSLAEAYAAKGETALAIQYYQKSLEINPDNQNAKDKLERLKKDGRQAEKEEPNTEERLRFSQLICFPSLIA